MEDCWSGDFHIFRWNAVINTGHGRMSRGRWTEVVMEDVGGIWQTEYKYKTNEIMWK